MCPIQQWSYVPYKTTNRFDTTPFHTSPLKGVQTRCKFHTAITFLFSAEYRNEKQVKHNYTQTTNSQCSGFPHQRRPSSNHYGLPIPMVPPIRCSPRRRRHRGDPRRRRQAAYGVDASPPLLLPPPLSWRPVCYRKTTSVRSQGQNILRRGRGMTYTSKC